MRSVFILTTLIALLTVGYLVIQNMSSHTQTSENGRIEEVEQARRAAAHAEKNVAAIRKNANLGNHENAPVLP